jgi:hypothetical protein
LPGFGHTATTQLAPFCLPEWPSFPALPRFRCRPLARVNTPEQKTAVVFYPGLAMVPSSHSQAVLPGSNLLVLESINDEQTHFVLNVRSEQNARCPLCSHVSNAFHSRYTRIVQDLPWQGRQVQLRVDVRRFRCRNRCCGRKIFAEQLPDVVRQYARRTNRVLEIVRMVGYSGYLQQRWNEGCHNATTLYRESRSAVTRVEEGWFPSLSVAGARRARRCQENCVNGSPD